MQLIRFFCLAAVCCAAPCGFGEIVSDRLTSALKLGVDQMSLTGPDHRAEELPAVGMAWHSPWTPWLRQITKFSYLADYNNRSTAMNIYRDIYHLYLGVEIVHPWLFRWHLSGGPLFKREMVHYVVKSDNASSRSTIVVNANGIFLGAGVDYAFNKDMECTFLVGGRSFSTESKPELFYGVAAVWNFSYFWSELPGKK